MAQISASPLCLSNSCVLPKLVEVELCPMWSCWEWGCYGPSSLPVQWGFYVRPGLHYVHNLFWPRPQFSPFKLFLCSQCQSSIQVYPRSSSFSIQPRCAPAEVYLRLASTLRWPELYMLVSPCSACHRPVVALSFGPLKLFLCPSWSPHQCGDLAQCKNLSSPSAPSQGCKSHPASSFLPFSFILSSYTEVFLVPFVFEVFCSCSTGILWGLLHLKMYPWCICGKRWALRMFFYSAILIVP